MKIGDIVRIKDLRALYSFRHDIPYSIVDNMLLLSGTLCTIKEIFPGDYTIEEYAIKGDGCKYTLEAVGGNEKLPSNLSLWSWSSPMFEYVATKNTSNKGNSLITPKTKKHIKFNFKN